MHENRTTAAVRVPIASLANETAVGDASTRARSETGTDMDTTTSMLDPEPAVCTDRASDGQQRTRVAVYVEIARLAKGVAIDDGFTHAGSTRRSSPKSAVVTLRRSSHTE